MGVLRGLGDGVQRLWSPLGDALQRGAACTAGRKPGGEAPFGLGADDGGSVGGRMVGADDDAAGRCSGCCGEKGRSNRVSMVMQGRAGGAGLGY